MRIGFGIAIGAALLFSPGCKDDACEGESPSFELDLMASGVGVRSLVIELSNGSARKKRSFDIGNELGDGTTSIAVDVEQSFVGMVTISARTYSMEEGQGSVLAEATGSFALAPNGCNRFTLDLSPAGGSGDGGMDAGTDAGTEDGATDKDAEPDRDAVPTDADDGGEPLDTGDDAGPPDPTCIDQADPNTVALYSMEGNLADTTGAHDGMDIGNASFDMGPMTCGQALHIPDSPNAGNYGRIPDSDSFDLAEGSLDLWLRTAAINSGQAYGVVSRDSSTAKGGFTLYMACDGTVVAKLDNAFVCSASPLVEGQWSYVGVNFGAAGFELWVDGVQATRVGDVGLIGSNCRSRVACGGTSTTGIAGNDNPWFLGVSADASAEGTGDPLVRPFRDGMIDAFRISDVRRSF